MSEEIPVVQVARQIVENFDRGGRSSHEDIAERLRRVMPAKPKATGPCKGYVGTPVGQYGRIETRRCKARATTTRTAPIVVVVDGVRTSQQGDIALCADCATAHDERTGRKEYSECFTLSIQCYNRPFQDGNQGRELARILRELADRLENDYDTTGGVDDIDGNAVGQYYID